MTSSTAFEMTQNEIKPGWEERFAQISPEDFHVTVEYRGEGFTPEEQERNQIKFQIIAEYAAELAYGMSKGSVKYLTDSRSPSEWRAFADDEERDLNNYRLLERASQRGLAGVSKPPESNEPPPEVSQANPIGLHGHFG